MPDPNRTSISASQAPALLDASPYITRFMLYHWLKGRDIDKPADVRMDAGTLMQPMLLEMARHDLNLDVQPSQVYVKKGQLGSTKDSIIFDPNRGRGTLETKACFDYRQWMTQWGGGDSPPRHVEIQTQQQMFVGDGEGSEPYKWGVIAVWLAGEMRYFEREPLPKLWDELKAGAATMFEMVEAGTEPEPFGDPVEVPLLNELYPENSKKILDLTLDERGKSIAEKALMYRAAMERRLIEDKMCDQLKADLLGLMTDHDEMALPSDIKVTLKKVAIKEAIIKRAAHIRNTIKVFGKATEDDFNQILPQLD